MNHVAAITLRPLILASVFLGFLSLVPSGCATTEEHTLLSSRVTELEEKRAKLEAKMAEDVKRLQELNETIKRSEATLRKSGANLGLRVSRLEQSLPRAVGRVDVSEHRLKSLVEDVTRIRDLLIARYDAVQLLLPKDLPSDPDGMWKVAQAKEKAGDGPTARAIYEVFESSHPTDKRAIQARLLRARILESEGKTSQALGLYRRIEKLYAGAVEIPSTILRMGELYVANGDCQRAKKVYRYLAFGKYKETPEAEKAKVRFEELKTTCAK